MKVEISPKEASIIQFAIVHTDELWKPSKEFKNAYEPKDEVIQGILNKMNEIEAQTEKSGGASPPSLCTRGQKENRPRKRSEKNGDR